METQYVGFGRRLVAWFLDALILGVINLVVGVLGYGSLNVGAGYSYSSASPVVTIIELAAWILYVVVYQSQTGQTLGKKVMGIRVVDATGGKPSMMTFFLRDVIGKIVSGLILGIGYLFVLWDANKQALHDKIASTYVVKA